MAIAELRGYTMRTDWHPIPEVGNWPLDHTGVAASTGVEWGCNGRKPSEEPAAKVVCTGKGEELWARAIAGPDGLAGIHFGFNGICHQIANRILIPAAVDVTDSPGNEIATPVFGKYGLGLRALVKRIKDAAAEANKQKRGSVPDRQVQKAVELVGGGLKDEWKIIERDIDTYIKPKLPKLTPDEYLTIKQQYLSIYFRREALFRSYELGKIAPQRFIAKMRGHLTQTLEDLTDLVGPLRIQSFFKVPVEIAAAYVFFVPPSPIPGRKG